MKYKIPKSLLTTSNPKTIKGEKKFGIRTYILYMKPYKENSLGVNMCPFATVGCATSCLNGSGHGGMQKIVKKASFVHSLYYFYLIPFLHT